MLNFIHKNLFYRAQNKIRIQNGAFVSKFQHPLGKSWKFLQSTMFNSIKTMQKPAGKCAKRPKHQWCMIYCTKIKAQPRDDAFHATAQSQITALDDTWYRVLTRCLNRFFRRTTERRKKRIQSARVKLNTAFRVYNFFENVCK